MEVLHLVKPTTLFRPDIQVQSVKGVVKVKRLIYHSLLEKVC